MTRPSPADRTLHLERAWEAAGIGDWEYDHRQDRLRLSIATRRHLGESAVVDAMPLAAWLACIHAEDRPAVEAAMSVAALGDEPTTVTYRFIWPDGHWSWIELHGAVTERAEDGSPLRSAGLRLDVTRLRTAETLLALQHDFTRVLAGAPARHVLGKAMLDMTLGLPEFDGGGLYWRHEDGSYHLAEHRGLGLEFVVAVQSVPADSAKARLIEAGTMMCSAVEGTAERHDVLLQAPEFEREGIRALMMLPIAAEGRSVACLNLASRNLRTLPLATVRALQSLMLQFGQALERVRAREQADRRQRNLEGFMSALRDYVFVLDLAGDVVYASPSVREDLGHGDELLGRSVLTLHPEALRAEAGAIVGEILAGRSASCPLPIQKADGSEVFVDTRVVRGEWNGQPALLGISRDVSAERARRAERESEAERRRVLMDKSRDGIAIFDHEHRIVEANRRFAEMLGYAPAEVIGLRTWDIDGNLDEAQVRSAFADLTTIDATFETRHRRRGGELHDVEVSASGALIDGRKVVITVTRDITERKRAQAELQHYRASLEDLVGERTAALEAANRRLTLSDQRLNAMFAMSQAAGELSEEEVLQRGINEAVRLTESEIGYLHFVNDDQETLRLAAWSTGTYRFCTAAHSDHYPVSVAGVWADSVRNLAPVMHNDYQGMTGRRGYPAGHAHLVRHLGVPVVEQGKVRMLLGVGNKAAAYNASDTQELQLIGNDLWRIFTRRRTELQLAVAKAAAEAANVAKSAFLANMSHEIRTPLNAIAGMTHLMRRAGVTPDQAERLAKIDAASKHLLEIINATLDLSKIEAGKFELEEAPVHLAALFANVASMLAARAQAKGLCLKVEPVQPTEVLLGDATRLQQALLNYAANAVKFTPAGHVVLRVRQQSETTERVQLRFEVEDTGIGIEPGRLVRLFSAFEQADNSITRQYGGTGLGLAITKKLAELMGGSAGASSEPGRGSTFWFTASLRRAGRTQAPDTLVAGDVAVALLRRHHAQRRLLLVEDEPVNREVAQMLLEETGLAIETALNGQQALTLAAQSHFDLILMDMQMPVMDGLQAARGIRQLPGYRKTPIVAMTANAFADDRQRCLEAGMDDFIAKPIEPEALFGTILAWLNRAAQA